MHLVHGQYKILDVFEKNAFQSMMLGSSVENPEDIVVINEVVWSPLFTPELLQTLLAGFINLQSHSEDEVSCQLVTPYHQGMPIGKYLVSRSLSFQHRINLCYEFLKALVSYSAFPPWIQDILIDEDQIIVWEDNLLYNELIILRTSDPAYPETVGFTRIQKKLHAMIGKLIGSPAEASPALLNFLERLKEAAPELDTLQAVYDDFQKVFLYDYYLNQDDTVPAVAPPAILTLPFEEEAPASEDIPEPEAAGYEPAIPEEAAAPWDPDEPAPPDETETAEAFIPPIIEMDSVDADMEKNLELFFNRNRTPAGPDTGTEESNERKKSRLWLLLAGVGLALIVWAAVYTFLPGGKPVAAFTSTQKDGVWVLENKSTFPKQAALKRCEWTVYQNGQLIELFDTYNLTLALEDKGSYQVVLRVMDHDGRWSAKYQETLENNPGGTGPAPEGASAQPAASGAEKLDQYTLKYSPERTHQDTAFFRTGSYSLQVSAGKKPETLDIQGVKLEDNGMVSFWIASEDTRDISLVFTGYNQNTKVFTQEVNHAPLSARQWEMRQFTVNSDRPVNRMTLTVKADSLVNLDDLSVGSFK